MASDKEKKTVSVETLQLELRDALESLGCLKVMATSSRHGDIRFICRVEDTPRWEKAMKLYLFKELLESNWYSFIGTKYFVVNNKIVFGWVLIWESEDLDQTVRKVRKFWSEVKHEIDGFTPSFEVISVNKPWENTGYEEIVAGRTGTRG